VAANKKLDIQILRIADDHAAADVAERLEVPAGTPVLASVYRFLEERCGLELAGGMADVTAANAGRGLARQLGVSPGAAVLRMEQVERTADERAVLLFREHYVPTVFNLSVRRVRRRGPS
jgi:hypothetical protein